MMQDKGHGRHETRTIQVLPAPEGCFPHAARAVLVERHVRDPKDGTLRSSAAALGITSRTAERGGTPPSPCSGSPGSPAPPPEDAGPHATPPGHWQ